LKISKFNKNGGVWDLDLPPIREISVGSILSSKVLGGLPISWAACETTATGTG